MKDKWQNILDKKTRVTDTHTGKQLLEELHEDMDALFSEIKETEDKPERDNLVRNHYDLIQVKRSIQSQLTALVKANMMKRKVGANGSSIN